MQTSNNNNKLNIFERDLSGLGVSKKEKDFKEILEVIQNAQRLTLKMNACSDANEIRKIFSELIGKEVDSSCWIMTPFYTDFGRNIMLGKNVLINHCCTFMDRGGIEIGDECFIAPKVNLVTINHDINPHNRTTTYCKKIVLEKRVWIGVGATICPGVRIGENSIIEAGAVVTKDVPKNVIVGGNPAKILREIEI